MESRQGIFKHSQENEKDAQSCHKDMCSTMFLAALFVIAKLLSHDTYAEYLGKTPTGSLISAPHEFQSVVSVGHVLLVSLSSLIPPVLSLLPPQDSQISA